MGFTREQLEAFRDAEVPDLVGPGVELLFVGINPGLWTAATLTHFCHPSNRFYPALRMAGLVDWTLDADVGLTPEQRADLVSRGIGITNLVNRATIRADELDDDEIRQGKSRVSAVVSRVRPRVVAFAGITAYRTAFDRRRAVMGEQSEMIEDSKVWVIPNPSGLNAHVTVVDIADWMDRVATEAGLR